MKKVLTSVHRDTKKGVLDLIMWDRMNHTVAIDNGCKLVDSITDDNIEI